jgi:hypothetical protein
MVIGDTRSSEILWHYTSLRNLQSIVEKEAFFATHIRYLNDISERDHSLAVLENGWHLNATTYNRENRMKIVTDALLLIRKQQMLGMPFVTSFTNEPDSLPLWRAYCPVAGIALGIRRSALSNASVGEAADSDNLPEVKVLLSPVEYLDMTGDKQFHISARISTLFAEYVTQMQNKYPDWWTWGWWHSGKPYSSPYTEDEWTEAVRLLADKMQAQTVLLKRSSFSFEGEERLVVPSVGERLNLIKYRLSASQTTLVPYVVLKLNSADGFFISHIMIGPSPDSAFTKATIELYFKAKGIEVTVSVSDIPFRDI